MASWNIPELTRVLKCAEWTGHLWRGCSILHCHVWLPKGVLYISHCIKVYIKISSHRCFSNYIPSITLTCCTRGTSNASSNTHQVHLDPLHPSRWYGCWEPWDGDNAWTCDTLALYLYQNKRLNACKTSWLVVSTPPKNISQMGLLFPIIPNI